MSMNGALTEAVNVSVIRGEFSVLQDVSLRVESHDFITIVGPNGAGKTTLLKCLLGLLRPDKGEVRRAPGVSAGYVPQRLSADYALPIRAGDFLTLRKRGHDLKETIDETGIGDVLDKPLHSLSGGELQRVLVARALLDSPDLLALDEPTQNLDASGQLAFYRLLSDLYKRRGIGIVMVSHDLHLVMAATRRVVCLYHHVCCCGEPQTVARDPAFTALLGGDMARMTAFYPHTHDHKHDHD